MTTRTNTRKDVSAKNKPPVSLSIDYPEKLDRATTFFRLFLLIPIVIILALITGSGQTITQRIFLDETGNILLTTRNTAGGLAVGLSLAVDLLIIFQQRYPR